MSDSLGLISAHHPTSSSSTPPVTEHGPPVRVVLLGDANVGKTTLMCQLTVMGSGPQGLALERHRLRISLPDGSVQPVDVWDASAQEMVDHFANADAVWDAYLADAKVLVLMYSDRNLQDIDNVKHWLGLLRERRQTHDCLILLLLNRVTGNAQHHQYHVLQNMKRNAGLCLAGYVNVQEERERTQRLFREVMLLSHYRQQLREMDTESRTAPVPALMDPSEQSSVRDVADRPRCNPCCSVL